MPYSSSERSKAREDSTHWPTILVRAFSHVDRNFFLVYEERLLTHYWTAKGFSASLISSEGVVPKAMESLSGVCIVIFRSPFSISRRRLLLMSARWANARWLNPELDSRIEMTFPNAT